MKEKSTFGNPQIALRMAKEFSGTSQKTIVVEMRYTQQVQKFVQEIENAHKRADNSTLVYRQTV
ncbi:hypothetical protein HY792_07075 [Candidatus Desantisbacteria bacterium]|nr:hypothetical protein [Candidatus Desantisbacteria bacterium]